MQKDEKMCNLATKEYSKAIDKFGLDNITDGWGQSKKRYMLDSFIAGFYAGRDYVKKELDVVFKITFENDFINIQSARDKLFYNLKNK